MSLDILPQDDVNCSHKIPAYLVVAAALLLLLLIIIIIIITRK